VAGFGLNSIDLITEVDDYPRRNSKQRVRRFARLPGGQAATAMVACARLGWRARYIGSFGDDENGTAGRASLEAEGVDVSAARTVAGVANQFAVIIVDGRTGDRTIMWDRPAPLTFLPDEVPLHAIASARVLLVDCHDTPAATRAAQHARAVDVRTVIDVEYVRPGIAELLRNIDVIIAAQDFPGALTGRAELGASLAAMAREYGAAVVCATLGVDGSLALVGGREIRSPAFKVEVVDTTGAGDVFRAGFIAGWLESGAEGQAADVLAYANAVAALKCRALGAREGIPRRHEVHALLAQSAAERT
jgi:sulfofructose kinase